MPVTFEAGSTRATVNVQITDDNVVESEEDFTAVLSSSESNVMIGENTATVSVLDNDGSLHFLKGMFQFFSLLVVVSFDPTSYTVTEGEDGFAELTLVRSGDTSGATVVTVTTADGSATGI